MKSIQPLVIQKDLDGIAREIGSMKRLWDVSLMPGLHVRRDGEARVPRHMSCAPGKRRLGLAAQALAPRVM